jgi:hypothetical protein
MAKVPYSQPLNHCGRFDHSRLILKFSTVSSCAQITVLEVFWVPPSLVPCASALCRCSIVDFHQFYAPCPPLRHILRFLVEVSNTENTAHVHGDRPHPQAQYESVHGGHARLFWLDLRVQQPKIASFIIFMLASFHTYANNFCSAWRLCSSFPNS